LGFTVRTVALVQKLLSGSVGTGALLLPEVFRVITLLNELFLTTGFFDVAFLVGSIKLANGDVELLIPFSPLLAVIEVGAQSLQFYIRYFLIPLPDRLNRRSFQTFYNYFLHQKHSFCTNLAPVYLQLKFWL
jgi:hypothetical protein